MLQNLLTTGPEIPKVLSLLLAMAGIVYFTMGPHWPAFCLQLMVENEEMIAALKAAGVVDTRT